MDVNDVFRLQGVDPAGAVIIGYVLGHYRFVIVRLPFGWRGNPDRWEELASPLQQAQRHTTGESAAIQAAEVVATAHVQVTADTGTEVEPLLWRVRR